MVNTTVTDPTINMRVINGSLDIEMYYGNKLNNVPLSERSKNVCAVRVENASKNYDGELVLNNFHMTVKQGTIYGLLGASGCGKTTILSCITGLKNLDHGNIRVFGKSPGSAGSGIPGTTIGYMPQEISLYETFTISEIFQFFGTIYGLSKKRILHQTEFLIDFLHLPLASTVINTLSGGQKRRVSLGTSLIHLPPVLILDEPTVGVDPLLRENIWEHLNQLVNDFKTTIIITTHYIEEASQCQKVGIMRNGRLLVEDNPQNLLLKYNTNSLETVFLKLCQKDEKQLKQYQSRQNNLLFISNPTGITSLGLTHKGDSDWDNNPSSVQFSESVNQSHTHGILSKNFINHHLRIVKALTVRNVLNYYRFPLFTVAVIFLPLFQTLLGNMVVGKGPKFTQIGVINRELLGNSSYLNTTNTCESIDNIPQCFKNKLSCQFFDTFDKEDFVWVPFDNEEDAIKSVRKGETFGFIVIPPNYTEYMTERALFGRFMTNKTIDYSTISIRLDSAYILKYKILTSNILLTYHKFIKNIVKSCGGNIASVEQAYKLTPIYGEEAVDFGYQEYLQPGYLLTVICLTSMASGYYYVTDRTKGTLSRCTIAGVKLSHSFVANAITEGCLLLVQIALSFGSMVFLFGFEVQGSTFLFVVIVFFQGILGLSFGFFFGNVSNYELELLYYVIGMYMPFLVSSGIVWPLNGLAKWAYIFCHCLPLTVPVIAARSVSNRGWGIDHPQVYRAFIVQGTWIICLCTLTGLVNKFRRK